MAKQVQDLPVHAPPEGAAARKRASKNAFISDIAFAVAAFNGVGHCYVTYSGLNICPNAKGGFAKGGTTIGNVFITNKSLSDVLDTPGRFEHEDRHATQWANEGPGMAIGYLLAVGHSEEMSKKFGQGSCTDPQACYNRYEVDAGLRGGGYLGG